VGLPTEMDHLLKMEMLQDEEMKITDKCYDYVQYEYRKCGLGVNSNQPKFLIKRSVQFHDEFVLTRTMHFHTCSHIMMRK
jgi:hypothetical protein